VAERIGEAKRGSVENASNGVLQQINKRCDVIPTWDRESVVRCSVVWVGLAGGKKNEVAGREKKSSAVEKGGRQDQPGMEIQKGCRENDAG